MKPRSVDRIEPLQNLTPVMKYKRNSTVAKLQSTVDKLKKKSIKPEPYFVNEKSVSELMIDKLKKSLPKSESRKLKKLPNIEQVKKKLKQQREKFENTGIN